MAPLAAGGYVPEGVPPVEVDAEKEGASADYYPAYTTEKPALEDNMALILGV